MIEGMSVRHHGKGLLAWTWPLLAVGATLVLACGRSPYKPSSDDAATIFMDACLPCHQGSSNGPSLAGRALTKEAIAQRLDHGGKGMPSFPGIKGEARTELVAYVVQLSSPASP